MLRILALAGFVMSGLVGFWQIAAGSVSPATPFFLIAMSVAFIFLYAGISRTEEYANRAARHSGQISAMNFVFADLLKQALDLKITEKDVHVDVRVKSRALADGISEIQNYILVKPISDIGRQAFDEIEKNRASILGKPAKVEDVKLNRPN